MRNATLRDLDIPYLAESKLPVDRQLKIADILVQCKDDSIFLFSKKDGKPIIPRIDNAYNFNNNNLPVYRFLASLQNQFARKNLNVTFQTFYKGIIFFPRIQFKEVILQPFQWILKEENLKQITLLPSLQLQIKSFTEKCLDWGIPEKFLWAEGDQTLFVDRQDEYSFGLLFMEMIKKKEILLREFYEPVEKGVEDETGSTYNHQLIAVLKNNGKHHIIPKVKQIRTISRSFSPGSEWFYVKIYCSVYVSNNLLLKVLYPLIQTWLKEEKIDNWFFVRYSDPDEHIRLRLHLNEIKVWENLLSKINLEINAYLSHGLVAKIAIDTYEREPERYNVDNYLLIEKYFEFNSDLCIRILEINQALNENHSLLLSIKLIDEVYNLLALSYAQKKALAFQNAMAFQNELGVDAEAKDVLHNFYHANHITIRRLIEHPASLSPMDQYLAELKAFTESAAPVLRQVNAGNEELISGLIHMHFNRLFNSHQRIFEMIGYYTLALYYKSNNTVS